MALINEYSVLFIIIWAFRLLSELYLLLILLILILLFLVIVVVVVVAAVVDLVRLLGWVMIGQLSDAFGAG